jgi:hypothetical protein
MIGALPMPASQNSFEDAMAVGKELLFGAKQRSSMIAEAERCFRRALEFMPQSADAMAHIARALDDQGRWTESKDWYERSLAIDPTNALARERHPLALRAIGMHLGQDRSRFTRFPESVDEMSDFETAIRRHCLSHANRGQITITPATKVVTLGSCFAANLAHALQAEGIKVRNVTVGEFFNSSYANLDLVQWLFGRTSSAAYDHLRHFGDGREEIATLLRQAELIIYTLGVAPGFFDATTGKFVMPERSEAVLGAVRGKYTFRNTSVDENFQNLRRIVLLIREDNPNCKFVFSLSPVPIAATLENRSPMEADCLSKATLRVAVEQLVNDVDGCIYWPSFEIVRWLGTYFPGMYGDEDGSTRHVSERVVRTIIRNFLQIYGEGTFSHEAAAAADATA